mmetsp:Transcript_252/g.722  ORF Transcript_252/g.722 Transcript_252/m.722 type:complete len:267 (-) Transcript_252:269-1069(-)
MGKGAYGTVEFWDEWYAEEEHLSPYDWLLAWEDIGEAIERWLGWDRGLRVLVVGCGNSPFSSELFARGYRNLVNVDNCESIIESQRLRYPMLTWRVGDVRRLEFDDASFDAVIDKGCLDNLYCYVDARDAVADFLREMARLLRPPRGRFVLVSCHDRDATRAALANADWCFDTLTVPNPRWPAIQVQTYQVALCQTRPDGLRDLLSDGLARTRLARRLSPRDPPRMTTPVDLPARLDHLERRSSGRRHSDLILLSDDSPRPSSPLE